MAVPAGLPMQPETDWSDTTACALTEDQKTRRGLSILKGKEIMMTELRVVETPSD